MRLSGDRLAPPGGDCPALTAQTFAALMAPFCPFESRPAMAVAVSGGRDSLTLALLAQEWASHRLGKVIGLIVDHGLRPEAAEEARRTRETIAAHGIDSEILAWRGAKPSSGVQEAAREARYRLLLGACRRRGILHLLVGHHADDQAETVTMRAGRGSGPDGLAGMAALVEHRHVRVLRPLLGVSRERLTATLRGRGVAWIDDPSNADPRFDRARLRAGSGAKAPGDDAASLRADRERAVAEAAVAAIECDGRANFAREFAIDRDVLADFDEGLRSRLLSRVVQAVGGRDHPPRRDRLERATGRLLQHEGRGKSGKGQDFTFSECRLMLRQGLPERRPRWIVSPENGTNHAKERQQPLIPAGFFACGAPGAPHLHSQPLPGSKKP